MRLFLAALVLAMVAGSAGPVEALGISPNPIDLLDGSNEVVARVTLVGTGVGLPAGGITLGGAVAVTDQTLLFTLEYVAPSIGPLAGLQIALETGLWSAVGWVPGAGVDWSASLVPPATGVLAASYAMESGDTSDVLFVSSASLTPDTAIYFGFQGYHGIPQGSGQATIIPEPTTLALLAGGLALLARARRR